MARVACVCGQQVTQFLINGQPRKSCPFCKRELTFDSKGQVVGAKTEEPRAREVSTPAKPVQALYPKSVVSPGSPTPAAIASAIVHQARSQPPPRYVNLDRLTASLERLGSLVDARQQGRLRKLVCARHGDCAVLACRRAFACGALPRLGSGPRYIALWTLGAAGAAVAFLGIITVILLATLGPNPANPPNLALGIAFYTVIAVVAGLIGFLYASLMSYGRQRHVRAVAAAAEHHGLHFLPFVEVPLHAVPALPVICPAPPQSRVGKTGWMPTATLAAAGQLQGYDVYLARYYHACDPRDYMPFGSALKVIQAVNRPVTMFFRQPVKRMYFFACFPALLPHTPDLVLTRELRALDSYYLKLQYNCRIIAYPDKRRKYIFTTTEPIEGARACSKLIELLHRSPGYCIQVVGGRLLVWKDTHAHFWPLTLPRAKQTQDLLDFASEVRAALMQLARDG